MRVVLNQAATAEAYSERERLVVSRALAEEARREIERWPEFGVTPLYRLDGLAARLGIAALACKDETGRLGLGSFKALGGAYAAERKLRELGAGRRYTLCCATDGNHGRSVAYAARRHDCECVVYMHEHAPAHKAAAIAALGARVERVAGTYDDSLREAQDAASRHGWVLIGDTNEDPLDQTTRHVLQGYGVMLLEVLEQLPRDLLPTHVFIQAGVGGLAAAVAGVLTEVLGTARPRVVVVEPETAACLLEAALQGEPVRISGSLRTVMHMLSAGKASPVAWPLLRRRAEVFLAVEDRFAVEAVRELARTPGQALDVGPSGAAGLAGLLAVAGNAEAAAAVGLQSDSRVLIFATERGEKSS